MGMQTDGNRFDATVGDMVIFSGFGANGAHPAGNGTRCERLSDGGKPYSCRRAYPLRAGRWYRYRIRRLEADATGRWWGAWIRDTTTGEDAPIGRIRLPPVSSHITSSSSFTAYFGAKAACDQIGHSRAIFTQPAADETAPGAYQHFSSLGSTANGSCPGASVTKIDLRWTQGARIVQ